MIFDRYGRAAARLLTLAPRDWSLLARAQVAIFRAAILVRTVPRGKLLQTVSRRYTELGQIPDLEHAEDLAVAIDRVGRFGIGRPRCLVRSIALHALLEKENVTGSRIRVGVRMNGPRFEAHAWVELTGRIIGEDSTYVQKFTPLSDLTEPALSSMPLGSLASIP